MLFDNEGVLLEEEALDELATGDVFRIAKTGQKGVPIIMQVDSNLGAGYELDVSILAGDEADMSDGEAVITFPTVDADTGQEVFIRRLHTDKQYIQAVATFSGYESGSADIRVFAGIDLMNEGE